MHSHSHLLSNAVAQGEGIDFVFKFLPFLLLFRALGLILALGCTELWYFWKKCVWVWCLWLCVWVSGVVGGVYYGLTSYSPFGSSVTHLILPRTLQSLLTTHSPHKRTPPKLTEELTVQAVKHKHVFMPIMITPNFNLPIWFTVVWRLKCHVKKENMYNCCIVYYISVSYFRELLCQGC